MICKYPKLPTGPSAVGAAGVRALDETGGGYQRKRPNVDTIAMVEGEFRRVLVDGYPEYVSRGLDAGDVTKVRDTKDFRLKFAKTSAKDTGMGLGRGKYLRFNWEQLIVLEDDFTYEIQPGLNTTAVIRTSVFLWTFDMASYYTEGFSLGGLLHYETIFDYSGSYYRPIFPAPAPLGYYKDNGVTAIVLTIQSSDRVDSAERPLRSPAITVWRQEGSDFTVLLDPTTWTREHAEFCPVVTAVAVTETATMFVLAEVFFRPGPTTPGEDYHPKFWLMHGSVDSPYVAQAFDVTSIAFDAAEIPSPSLSPISHYKAGDGDEYNRKLTQTMAFMRSVVLPDDVVLWFYSQSVVGGWRSRIMRSQRVDGVASASKVFEGPIATLATLQFVQYAEHIGSGWVLAKRINKFGGIDADVVFMRSADGGATWSDLTPIGFDCPLKNQYFGDFKTHKAREDEDPGIVLIPAWSTEKQAYCVYASKDDGTTWERRAVIYKPEEFRRIDTVLVGDGGDNFNNLLPGPDPTTPLDVTIKDRYKRAGNV